MIAWEESGAGAPVVFVHGITECRRAWDRIVPLLDDRFRCIRLDLRGHGGSSDADDYSAPAMAHDVAEVVAAARVEQPPVLVGHSLGAVVATMYAAQAPSSAVVNIDQSLRLGDFATALAPLAEQLRGPGFGEAMSAIFGALGDGASGDGGRLDPADAAYLRERHAQARPDVVLGVWSSVLDSPPDDLTALAEAMLGAVRVPYLAVHGSDPGAGYASWLAALVEEAAVEVWDGDGHYPHLVEPERFAARLRDWEAVP